MDDKSRLDKILVDKGLVQSRERAKALIMAGMVFVNGKKIDKAGTLIKDDADICLKKKDIPYVSRGGIKLKAALESFNIDIKNRVCLDVGASTGGFTDCLLQYGAKIVYAIDVGYGQLDWKLRNDSRVVNIEKTNIRYFNREKFLQILKDKFNEDALKVYGFDDVDINEKNLPDLAVVDVSFISLSKVLLPVYQIIKEKADVIALIKPQFEAERKEIKKGIVKDKEVIKEVIEKIKQFSCGLNFKVKGVVPAPIKSAAGNREQLIHLQK
ncbi:TlyA family RNA methyltransferase [bacterium]|nr:TlyA family RNA methyltransferase [bacterium]